MRKDGKTLSSPWMARLPSLNSTEQSSTHDTANCNCTLKLLNSSRNSVTGPLLRELIAAYDLLDRDDRVRVVVLTADHTAPAFCSGVRL